MGARRGANEVPGPPSSSLLSHAAGEHLTLDDFVHRLSGHRVFPRELPSARRATKVAVRAIVYDPFHETLDQSARAAFSVTVQQCTATRTVDRDGATLHRPNSFLSSILPTRGEL